MPLDLTPAEIEVIEKLCEGWSMQQIAHKLCKAQGTLETRVAHARRRNEIASTLYLCVLWATRGNVSPAKS